MMKLEPIAIVGIGCRFPGAENPASFWKLIRDGGDAIADVPPSRWDLDRYYDTDGSKPNKANTRWGGFLENIDRFDPQFFGISPREATLIDPQQRLLLEVAYEALEDGGQIPANLAGTQTGVFIGIGTHDYSILMWQQPVNEGLATIGTGNCIAANRISYAFDLKGPSLAVDTACSSALVAVHLACQSIWHGESTMALAGGVNILLLPTITVSFSKGGFMSPDGRCKSFDDRANGYVRSEGAGIVVLKPLSQARADGDSIYAVIRGSAVNQDGTTNGIASPNPQAQEAVLREAYRQAAIDPSQVQYIEAHGTGTTVGDRIELQALGAVASPNRPQGDYCAIGSVKTNIGHAETAAGIAGLIKVALALKHQQIPPSLHCQQPNSSVPWQQLALRVQQQLTPWYRGANPAIAGVNSFGFGGTNAHVVVEEAATTKKRRSSDRPFHLFTLSAKNFNALRDLAKSYQTFLVSQAEINLADLCFTLNSRRTHFQHRLALVTDTIEHLHASLQKFIDGETDTRYKQVRDRPKIVFLFTGQGSQYIGMAKALYRTQPHFRATLDRCSQLLEPYLGESLIKLLYPPKKLEKVQSAKLDRTRYTQPALFAIEYSLAQLWLSWGVQPQVVLGHSLGEYVAAAIAGVFGLEDGLKLIAARGRLMEELAPNGAMVAVAAEISQVRKAIEPYEKEVSIAAINSPQNVVISGEKEAIARLVKDFTAAKIKTTPLKVSHAFHSPLMESAIAEFRAIASEITYYPPQIELISNLTGKASDREIATPEYWCEHILKPVNFADSIANLARQEEPIFLEIGSKPILLGLVRECLPEKVNLLLPSLRPDVNDWQQMLASLSQLYLQGIPLDWQNIYVNNHYRVLHLPTYPFQRQSYWWEGAKLQDNLASETSKDLIHPLLGKRLTLANSDTIYFQNKISQACPVYLKDHVVFDRPVLPATAYLEIAYAAGHYLSQSAVNLEDLRIERPLIIDRPQTIQVLLTAVDELNYRFEIFSLSEEENAKSSLLHASGKITIPKVTENGNTAIDLQELLSEFSTEIDRSHYYQQMSQQGLNYGSAFQGIQQLWVDRDRALGKIQLPESAIEENENYFFHPALLDACLQVLGTTLTEGESQDTYLPIGVKRWQIFHPPATTIWTQIELKNLSPNSKVADLEIYDDRGIRIAKLEGLSLRRLEGKASQLFSAKTQDLENCLYEVDWEIKPLNTDSKKAQLKRWLIFSDRQGTGEELARSIASDTADYILVFEGDRYQKIDNYNYFLNPDRPEDFKQLLTDIGDLDVVVHLWSLDTASDRSLKTQLEELDLNVSQRLTCQSTLYLVQALNNTPLKALYLVTCNSQALTDETICIERSPMWGLGRAIALEYPHFNAILLDLDSPEAPPIYQEACYPDKETQILYRQGIRRVARLVKRDAKTKNEPIRLKISSYGVLDNLTLTPLTRRSPADGEVEIQVYAAGVNFRDVLNALGMLREFLQQMGLNDAEELPFGGECAGKITAIGAGVEGLKIGDEVIAVCALGSLASFVNVKAEFVVVKPKSLSFTEAATIPTAFLTAYYGLYHQAKLKKGDRVLIHAAAGGVGQAAVQLAQLVGAEIYATASAPKWDFLKSLGLKRIFNSRSLEFASEIQAMTEGKGVDVVLNSLNGEFIEKSLETLANKGRFIEIGKIGIWDKKRVTQKRPDVDYLPFDLLEISQQQPQLIRTLLQELMEMWERGTLKPLTHRVFQIEDAKEAFRTMAQAKHIGKAIISIPQASQSLLSREGSYLITGGLGALGLQVAEWLVEKGAIALILVGRSQPNEDAKAKIERLESLGAKIQVVEGDVSRFEDVNNLIQSQPNLKGIIHAAGILDDGIMSHLSWERFDRVASPKILGAWNLHQCSQHLSLDFFVCFSSIVSVIGSPGQASYGAGNAFLDALAHYRRQLELPATTINWGPWAGKGMAESQQQWESRGIVPIEPSAGLAVLEKLLQDNTAQVSAIAIDWTHFLAQTRSNLEINFFERLLPKTPATAKPASQFLQQFATTPESDRASILLAHVCTQLANVLGFSSPDAIETDTHFDDLGMDSLMAVELKNSLQNSLQLVLDTNLLFEYPTPEALSDRLLSLLNAQTPGTSSDKEAIDSAAKEMEKPVKSAKDKKIVPPQYYKFELTPEYLALKQDLTKASQIGNYFFIPHEEVAKNTTILNGRELINYASYNYLGLSGDERVSQATQAAIARYGTSVSASRVVSGEIPLHRELEREIADFLGTEDAIAYIGGHATNVSTIGHLFGSKDSIVYDSLSHNSIRQGCLISGATAIEFPHNDWQTLDRTLEQFRDRYEKVLVVVEGIYSTDGDLTPLPEIIAVKRKHKAFLMVDEAHSLGVLGNSGRGIGEHFQVSRKHVDLWMGTLSKSLASCGGYIAGSAALVEYLKYTAPGFVYSVGMSPANTAAALAALRILKDEPERVSRLQQNAKHFLNLAKSQGLNVGHSQDSPIIPVIVGDRDLALRYSQALFQQGIHVQPMVYPSVPLNAARLRFFLSSAHTEEQIHYTLAKLADISI